MLTVTFSGKVVRQALGSLSTALILAALLAPGAPARATSGPGLADTATVFGTWAGRSICVGNRPACRNEDVVYRILPTEGKPELVTLLADKIIEGKRVPMGALQFSYKDVDRSLTCEFRIGSGQGVWSFKVVGDKLTGTLTVLPGKTLARRVSVHRVRDDEVPAAPDRNAYE